MPGAPEPGHRVALARALRYVSTHRARGLLYRKKPGPFRLDACVDAAHGSELHKTVSGFCKSRSGGAITAGGASITAFSSSQAATALSSFEAELYAFTFLVRLLLAQRNLATFITGTTLPASVVLCDNMSVSCSILTVVPNEDHTRPLARSTEQPAAPFQ